MALSKHLSIQLLDNGGMILTFYMRIHWCILFNSLTGVYVNILIALYAWFW